MRAMKEQVTPPTPDDLVDTIVRTHFAVRRRFSAALSQQSASMPQVRMLMTLAEAGRPLRMRDLARRLGMSNRTVTPLVDALDRAGLLSRGGDPRDRRAVLVQSTNRGQAEIAALRQTQHEVSAEIAGPLSAEELGQMVRLLRQVLSHLEPDQPC
jgi:DNA-binding MarR family transcriptional regulator